FGDLGTGTEAGGREAAFPEEREDALSYDPPLLRVWGSGSRVGHGRGEGLTDMSVEALEGLGSERHFMRVAGRATGYDGGGERVVTAGDERDGGNDLATDGEIGVRSVGPCLDAMERGKQRADLIGR